MIAARESALLRTLAILKSILVPKIGALLRKLLEHHNDQALFLFSRHAADGRR